MPAQPRRTSRRGVSELETENKRARGEIACAECRRLKLKCDRQLPCSSCVRRGCTTICPNGSLSAGKGTRFVLADTEQLHRKIAEMSERIRQLEDALAIFQKGISEEKHHLLRDELLTIKFGPEVRRTVDDEHTRDIMSQTIDALGTLTVGEYGEIKYIGRSGSSEALFLVGALNEPSPPSEGSAPDEDSDLDGPALDWETDTFSFTFPFSGTLDDADSFMDRLEAHLPSQPRAWALCETYLEHFSWWFRPIKRDELVNDVLSPIYKKLSDPSKGGYTRKPNGEMDRSPHLLAVLFMVLATGALVDLTLPACSGEAEKYYRLARAALGVQSVFDSPGLETVQAIALMASYQSQCVSRYTVESGWALISLASKLGQAIGLHRDSSAWKMDDKLVQRRRNLFWEIFMLEMMHAVALGRPPSISLNHVDCELPTDEESIIAENGGVSHSYWQWRFVFSQKVYSQVMDTLLAAKPPSYATILDLDKRIRQTTLPSYKIYRKPDEPDYDNVSVCMKGWLISQYQSFTMLYIHRTFFAQALLDRPDNPLSSPYAPSFLAANRCASSLIRSFLHHYERCPDLSARFWGIWTHAFTAAIILGSTVYRSPGVSMAEGALAELNLLLEPFSKAAVHSKRARQAYGILRDLKSKAERSYQQYRYSHASPTIDLSFHVGAEAELNASRLAIFGGQTRVMATKGAPRRRGTRQKSGNQSSGSPSSASGNEGANSQDASPGAGTPPDDLAGAQHYQQHHLTGAFGDVHPSLVEYLSSYPGSSALAGIEPQSTQALPSGSIPPLDVDWQPHAFSPFIDPSSSASIPPTPGSGSTAFSFYPDLSVPSSSTSGAASPHMHTTHEQDPLAYDSPITMQDLGFTEDVMTSEHWMTLMRETGILDGSGQFANGNTNDQQQPEASGSGTTTFMDQSMF